MLASHDLFNPHSPIKREPRYYQVEAEKAVWERIGKSEKGILVSMATGTGKSTLLAMLCGTALSGWPGTGILIVTSVKELVRQNFEELIEVCPEINAGLYSAGLGIKNLSNPVTIASIQSIWKKAYNIPHRIDLIFIDECQDTSDEDGTMFRRFIDDLLQINPDMRICGLSATIYRMKQGMLTEGENALFSEVAYEYGLLRGINDGFLSPLTTKTMGLQFDVTDVKISAGEYNAGQLERAVDKDYLTVAVVDELIRYGADRKCWLAFCAGVDHAIHVRDEIQRRGFTCETVSAKTPHAERDAIFRRYKAGEIRCITNVNVMSKGTNVPQIDLISFLCPCKSPGRVVQWAGRGTRLYPSKKDCLILDHAGILAEHGPLDLIAPKAKRKGAGEAPVKFCPSCKETIPAGTRICPHCDHEFLFEETEINKEAATNVAVLSTQLRTENHAVSSMFFFRHAKEGRPDSLRVEYMCGPTRNFRQWFAFESVGRYREMACSWWRQSAGTAPPNSVTEALDRQKEVRKPQSIDVRKVGKYHEIVRENP